jgi:SSS family solute:Na+ symporter
MHLPAADVALLVLYLAALTAYGAWFFRKNRDSERFMAAGRALPGWAVGLSIFGSYVSSISFLANPGKAYGDNWNSFVFSLSLPLAAWVAVRWFVPFYRKSGDVSAYHHLEHRFGGWARTYAVVCYLLTQIARMGTILYLLALALVPLLGWDIRVVILLMGALMIVYPLFGGTEAVIWVGVVQAVTLVLGALICLVFPIFGMPEGPGQVFRLAAEHDKFSLGSFGPSLTAPTFWVVLVYGLFINLQNFGIDQTYIQRYITARSDRDAARSVWMGALLYIPLSAVFFMIGTALFAFYTARPELLPAALDAAKKPDAVLPHFIGTQLPVGMAGLIVAAICAAALDSNLNCMATLSLCDVYRRYFRPQASEAESMRVLRAATLFFGVLGTGTALAMIEVKNALDAWWQLAGIFSGGMLGLFLLGMLSRAAGRTAGITGTAVGVAVILWMTLSPNWPAFRSEFHGFLTIVFGTTAILLVGFLMGWVLQERRRGSG